MNKKYQKNIFLESEGDGWFRRNEQSLYKKGDDRVNLDILIPFLGKENKILEIGCSNGQNLNYLQKKLPNYKLDLYGVDPSKESVKSGNQMFKEIKLKIGTSDQLEFDNKFFDVIICGFFLYLVDRDLLFKTVSEIDRVLKEGGYLIIVDFDVPLPYCNDYHHYEGIKSYKNDYSKFFTGGSHYTVVGKKSFSHISNEYFHKTINERVSTTILFKELIKDIY
jgi:ubiquinone/menaquinone biosynthesis C-methylase UbiE